MTLPRTIGRILELAARACPGRIAVSLEDEARTFAECNRQANRFAHALAQLGLRRGDRLLFWGSISLDTFDIFFATQRLGVAFVPINPSFSVDEMAPTIDYVRPALLVADRNLGSIAAALCDRSGVAAASLGSARGCVDLVALAESVPDDGHFNAMVEEEDIHAIFLTSGSTGTPKGVMVSHRASWNRAMGGNTRHPACGGRGEVNMFPLFHWAGWHFTLCAWMQKRAIHLTPRADAASLNAIIERWRPRYMYAIPAVWQRLLDSEDFGRTQSLAMIGTGTYRVEPSLIADLRARLPGIQITIGMGATELGVAAQIGDDDIDRKPYSVGLRAPGIELKIEDDELCGRSDQMMSGYFALPEQTTQVIRDGWYHTGDLAELDEEGYITITGRRREIIRSGGETVAPAEVEAAIGSLSEVQDVCVIGMPDKHWGEVVAAVIVLREGAAMPDVEAMRAALTPVLASYKHPRLLFQLSDLPRTPATGQIQRSKVQAMILEKQTEAVI